MSLMYKLNFLFFFLFSGNFKGNFKVSSTTGMFLLKYFKILIFITEWKVSSKWFTKFWLDIISSYTTVSKTLFKNCSQVLSPHFTYPLPTCYTTRLFTYKTVVCDRKTKEYFPMRLLSYYYYYFLYLFNILLVFTACCIVLAEALLV